MKTLRLFRLATLAGILMALVGASLVTAAVALMALVGASSASATALYNGTTKLGVGSNLDFSLKSGTNAKMTNTAGSETIYECASSTVKGSITNAGGVGARVVSSIGTLTFQGCTVSSESSAKGGLEINQIEAGTDGTVKATGEIGLSYNTVFFGICSYGVKAGTDLGKVTTFSSGTARFLISTVTVKLSSSNFACPETTKWTAEYVSTEPDNLRVEAS